MSLATVSSRVVLASLKSDPHFLSCYLSNSDKQLYMLTVKQIDPENLRIDLKPPEGRVNPIDPNHNWDLSFRDRNGAYRATIRTMTVEDSVVCINLQSYLQFLARRKSIRLPANSRNPITIRFTHQGKPLEGVLADFSLQGVGVFVPSGCELAIDEIISDGSFSIRNHAVSFSSARIANTAFSGNRLRVGLHFGVLSADQAETITEAFNAWHLSQGPTFDD